MAVELWELTQVRLQSSDTVMHVPRAIAKDSERLVGHSLDGLLHRQHAGGLTCLLFWCTVHRDPLSDEPFSFLIRREIGRSLFAVPVLASAQIVPEAAMRFFR